MKTIMAVITVLSILIASYADARPIKFGFYHTWKEEDLDKEFGSKEKFEERLKNAVSTAEKLIGIKIQTAHIERLPFDPPPFTPPNEKYNGISLNDFFEVLRIQKLPTNDADFVFTITNLLLWKKTISTEFEPIFQRHDGYVENIPGIFAIIDYNFKDRDDYLLKIIMHEWGHLLGLEHTQSEWCEDTSFVMCNPNPPGKLILETLYKKTAHAIACAKGQPTCN